RCDNHITNPKSMINSILERHRRRVTIDRVLVSNNDDNSQTLITDQDEIKVHVNAHFQQVAGGAQPRQILSPRWAAQYSPIARINEQWYDRIMDPPSIDEWSNIITHLANGKAPGPSGVFNEMINMWAPKCLKLYGSWFASAVFTKTFLKVGVKLPYIPYQNLWTGKATSTKQDLLPY